MNTAAKYSKIIIPLFIIYLTLAPTVFLESGLLRFFPTMTLMLTALLGVLSFRKGKKAKMGTTISLLCIYICIMSFVHSAYSEGILTTFLKSTYWCWIYFISYCIFTETRIKEQQIDNYLIIITLMFCLSFFYNHFTRNAFEILEGDNSVFYPLMFLPWIATSTSTTKRWIMLILVAICSIIALKRSGVIIISSVLVILYFRDFLYKNKNLKQWILGIAVIISCILVYQFFSSSLLDVSQRFEMIEDDGGNGREMIYEDVIERYTSSDIVSQLFGKGYNSVTGTDKTRALSAHNDFLEVLYDFGAIGFVCYLLIHLSLITWTIRLFRRRSPISFPVLVSYVCFIVMSMVSHLILYPTYFGLLVSFWAYAECRDRQISYCINHQV